MPSEVTRFRVARAPQRACVETPRRPPLRLDGWLEESEFLRTLVNERPSTRDVITQIPDFAASRAVTSAREFAVPHADQLARFDEWLRCHDNHPDVPRTIEMLKRVFDREPPGGRDGNQEPQLDGFASDDPLRETATLLAEEVVAAAHRGTPPTTQRNLVRVLLVLGLARILQQGERPDRGRGAETSGGAGILWVVKS